MSETRLPINQLGQQHFAAAGLASSTALTVPTVTSTARQAVRPAHIMITANGAAGGTLFVRFDGTAVTAINGIAIPIAAGTSSLLTLMDPNFDYQAMIVGMRLLTSDASALVDCIYFD